MSDTDSINAFTVDVEDYFHVAALSSRISRADWDDISPRVEKNTQLVLDVLDEAAVKGTFFVLGWVAERFPSLVKDIHSRGHEVACHGYSHKLVYEQTPSEFREETIRAKGILEDLVGHEINGYRAASYSITKKSYWAFDTLLEAGFSYDSSVFPIAHDRYGDRTAPRFPYKVDVNGCGSLIEFPLSTWKIRGLRIPIAGGGYFRIFPYTMTKAGLRSINTQERRPFIFYLHPWELDPGQPKVKVSVLSTFRHYRNLHRTEHRLRNLLKDFSFTTVSDVLSALPATSMVRQVIKSN
jgi:polysaccharide deacetylase family protein (PEP-CTERM system associated)